MSKIDDKERIHEIAELGSRCVHCGFCLSACPTYAVTHHESDSPRGRILMLVQASEQGNFGDATLRNHIDRCIGCEACVPACPSGVRYDKMLANARVLIEQARPMRERVVSRAVIGLVTNRRRVRASLVARSGTPLLREVLKRANRKGGSFASRVAYSMIAQLPSVSSSATGYAVSKGHTDRVGLLRGCVASVFQEQVNEDAKSVLDAEKVSVSDPPTQGCCGALAMHAGNYRLAQSCARKIMDQFPVDSCDQVLVTSAGCGAAMGRYQELFEAGSSEYRGALEFSLRVQDVMVYLARREPRALRGEVAMTAGYHEPCHLAFAQGVLSEPRAVLGEVPGLNLETVGGLSCCGSGGTYSLVQRELASEIAQYKINAIQELSVPLVISGNPGCTMWLAPQLPGVRFVHPITVLRWSLDNARKLERGKDG